MAKKKKAKSKFIIILEYYSVVPLIKIVRLLPLQTAYKISAAIIKLIYLFDSKHRERTVRHMLYGGIADNEKDARQLAKKNFHHFSRVSVEIAKAGQLIKKDNVFEHLSLDGCVEEAKEILIGEKKEPAIIVTAHYGNWELAGKLYTWVSGFPMTSIMRKLSNPKLGEFVYERRQGEKHKTIPKEKGIKPLISALRKGESVAIVADQHASASEGIEVMFFGHPARAHATPAFLHLKTGRPIIVGGVKRIDDKPSFEFTIPKVIRYAPTGNKKEDIKNITQMYTSALEDLVRETPEQWLWAHRRWLDIRKKDKERKV